MKTLTISREKNGKYFLTIPYDITLKSDSNLGRIVAIDPGIKKFHTFYSPKGSYGKIGDGIDKKIEKQNIKMDKIQSIISKEFEKKKKITEKVRLSKRKNKDNLIKKVRASTAKIRKKIKGLKRKWVKIRKKTQNIIKDMHRKTANFYCENYDYIILPDFKPKEIAKKLKNQGMKNIGRETIDLSHGKFVQILKTKVSMYKNKKLIIVKELETSITCGNCGALDRELGKKRVYNCKHCKYTQDRDLNAARNILIRALMYIKGLI